MRCGKCSKALDAGMCEREGTPYCSRCYDQTFGIEAQGFVVVSLFVLFFTRSETQDTISLSWSFPRFSMDATFFSVDRN